MRLTFDVIITTYNRSGKVNKLCGQILECTVQPQKLIVVDSSDTADRLLEANEKITYRRSSHKSQPYQRYVGSLVSQADILVFFDDDLVITDYSLFERICNLFTDEKVMGAGLGIEYHNIITNNYLATNRTITSRLRSAFFKRKRIEPGKLSLFGETSGLPAQTIETLYLPGPNMCFRKKAVEDIFDDTLFALFEQRIGMGEDKVLSMRVARKGKLIYSGEKNYLLHPAEESSYFTNTVNFYARVHYSRLWIANQYARLWNVPLLTLKKILFCFKVLLTATSPDKIKAAVLTATWIKKYGWNQQHVNHLHINYKQQALTDGNK